MGDLRPLGAVLVIVGAVMLYLLRGPLVSLVLLVLEFLTILVAIVLLVVGLVLLVGGRPGRRFWMLI